MVRKHPEVIALAVLTLLSMASAWHPLPAFQISSSFPDAPEFKRMSTWGDPPRLEQFRLQCPIFR